MNLRANRPQAALLTEVRVFGESSKFQDRYLVISFFVTYPGETLEIFQVFERGSRSDNFNDLKLVLELERSENGPELTAENVLERYLYNEVT